MAYTVARQLLLAEEKGGAGGGAAVPSSSPPPRLAPPHLAAIWGLAAPLRLRPDDPVSIALVDRCSARTRQEGEEGDGADGAGVSVWRGATAADLALASSGMAWLRLTDDSAGAALARGVGEAFRGACSAAAAAATAAASGRPAPPGPGAQTPPPNPGARSRPVGPRHACEVLRAAALLHPRNGAVVAPYLAACRELWGASSSSGGSDPESPSRDGGRFLSTCTLAEVSRLAWFLRRVHCRDPGLVLPLARRAAIEARRTGILSDGLGAPDDDAAQPEPVSPRLVCRILADFTALFGLLEQDSAGGGAAAEGSGDEAAAPVQLSDLFGLLAPHLLLSRRALPARELSSVLRAYGGSGAAAAQDAGIFDRLAAAAAARRAELSARQAAQCLWACGRAASLEASSVFVGDRFASEEPARRDAAWNALPSSQPSPPYLADSILLADHLAHHAEELSTHDVTQAIWALGHLLSPSSPPQQAAGRGFDQASAAVLVGTLARRAKALNERLSHREVANILWGMARAGSKDYDVVYALTRRFATETPPAAPGDAKALGPSSLSGMSSQECALVLQAMARLDVRDAAVFRSVSGCMLRQVEATKARSIAAALAAHRDVHLPPAARADRTVGGAPARPAGRGGCAITATASWPCFSIAVLVANPFHAQSRRDRTLSRTCF
jgi:hypothetical protein